MMKFKQLTFFGLSVLSLSILPFGQIQAQTKTNVHPDMLNRSKLLADRSKLNNEQLVIDSVLLQIGLEEEEDLYPSDELYEGNWNNEYVKAYSNISVPDSFRINVSEFVMPVEGRVTSNYGQRRRRFHYGTDFKLAIGDTVRAAFDGKVRIVNYERRGYGNYIVLRHPNGLETVYGHLSRFLINEETIIKAGQPIGLGGNTGRSTGPHLHFEFRFLGRAINPGEIIDFEAFTVKDDEYVYVKGISELPSGVSKYAFKSNGKIRHYRIKKGDTLGAIARRTGVSVDRLCRLNKIKKTAKLQIGSSIRLS